MRLKIALDAAGYAGGVYTITAPGCALASLYWADEQGPLDNWTAFAHVPLDEAGRGEYRFGGGRAIPPQATHAAARLTAPDGEKAGQLLAEVCPPPAFPQGERPLRIGVMSDLHLSSKPYRIRRAMRLLGDTDFVLLAGDMTNDGLPEQFEQFRGMIEEELSGVPVLCVTGNHDRTVRPLPLVYTGTEDYARFEAWLLDRARALGVRVLSDPSGAYEAEYRGCAVFGLNCVTHFRRFEFDAQQTWLAQRLDACSAAHRIVLCHAPLRSHNSNDRTTANRAYFSGDKRLQGIIDGAGSLCFISGHTHVSVNEEEGCAEYDAQHDVVYLNDSSVTRTALRESEATKADREWTDGAVILLTMDAGGIEIMSRTVFSGRQIARGYHRFEKKI